MSYSEGLFKKDGFEPIRDPVWKHIHFPEEFQSILVLSSFAKLARIRQLGPAYLAYPGATHTRFSHSLGVFEMAKRTLDSYSQAGLPSFITSEGAKSFLAAALVHDTGHFPYAHSLKELPLIDHEVLTAKCISETDLSKSLEESGAIPEMVSAIIDKTKPDNGNKELIFFRQCLSGVLDPDKLDYLTRDAFFCGVPYGIQDVDFVFQHLAITSDGKPGIDKRGIMSVEGLLFSKYLMYKSVYWQRTVRSATSMIKKAVLSFLKRGLIKAESLYGCDDSDFLKLLNIPGEKETRVINRVLTGNLYHAVLEVPFDINNPNHINIVNLDTRTTIEKHYSKILSDNNTELDYFDVIIDLPEPIGFESDLFVTDINQTFNQASAVFNKNVINTFVTSLRNIKLFVSEKMALDTKELRNRTGL